MLRLLIFSIAGFTLIFSNIASHAAEWVYPAIEGFGAAHPLPQAAVQPDASLKYKVIFDVTKAANEGKINSGLEHAAKYLNIMASAGLPSKEIQAVVVVHGPATTLVLSNTAFQEKFRKENPDGAIIQKLSDAGVKFYVCGQSLAEKEIDQKLVNDKITVALSAMSTVTTYQLKGFGYLPF